MKQKLILTEIFVKKCRVTSKKLRPTTSTSSPPPEGSGDPAKEPEEKANDPPLPDVSTAPETQVSVESEMEAPADNIDHQPDTVIPSPTRESRLSETNIEEGTVAAATANAPDSSAALGKSSLEAMSSKGKDKLDLPSLENADLDGLHEALRTRLLESQEIAKTLANKPKVSHKYQFTYDPY